jgi:hypothetical protein
MSHTVRMSKMIAARFWMFPALLVLTTSLISCSRPEIATAQKAAAQKTFASQEEASAAFVAAAKSGDQNALLAIFGPDARDIMFSGDPVKDKIALQDFVAAYAQMNRWRQIKAGGQMLYTGADNHLFPIPLDRNSSGQWYFDTAAGKDEILARRIGKGELTAIAACGALADAQERYFSQTHDGDSVKQYAQKFVSDAGKQNGLYWQAAIGLPPSPLGPLGEFAKTLGYRGTGDKPQPFDGYFFRILTKQGNTAQGGAKDYIASGKMTGGFAFLAYPAEYRNSGIMTFIIAKDGVVYQKDLGEKTREAAVAMTDYDPGDGWEKVSGMEENKQ